MISPDPSPHPAMRRRVRVLMTGGVLAVLTFGFWPMRGYHIDDHDAFARSFDPPLYLLRDGISAYPPAPATYGFLDFPTFLAARRTFENQTPPPGASRQWLTLPQGQALVTEWRSVDPGEVSGDSDTDLICVFRYRNVVLFVGAYPSHADFPPNTPPEKFLSDQIGKMVTALEERAPGVSVENIPIAVQLWRDKVAPFLKKHFPSITAP